MLSIDRAGYESPDSTYFRTGNVEPELEVTSEGEQILKLVNGQGTRRSSWGHPGVTSTVVLESSDLVAVHVGFYHKHGGGQLWRYYVPGEDGLWQQVSWRQLSDTGRQWVLDAMETYAPDWAETPGKLKTQYSYPDSSVSTSYKIVQVLPDGSMASIYDPDTIYTLGKRLCERVQEDHEGGYYSFLDQEDLFRRFGDYSLFPRRFYEESMCLALLACEISGRIIEYPGGKLASTYLRPVEVINVFDYIPEGR